MSLAWPTGTGRICGREKEAHKTLAQNPQNSTWLCRKEDSSQGALRPRNRQSVAQCLELVLYFTATVKRYKSRIWTFSCAPPCKMEMGWAGAGAAGRRSTPFIFGLGMRERAKKLHPGNSHSLPHPDIGGKSFWATTKVEYCENLLRKQKACAWV